MVVTWQPILEQEVNSNGGKSECVQTQYNLDASQPDKRVHTASNYASEERFLMNNQKSNRVNSWLTVNTEHKICECYLKKK